MENLLDIRTLALFGGLAGLLISGIMAYVSLARRTYPGFHHWTMAYVLGGAGLVLMSLRHVAPDFISIVMANVLVILQPLLLSRGMAVFVRAPSRTLAEGLIMLAFSAIVVWFTYAWPSVTVRIINFNLAFAIFTLRLTLLTVRRLPALPHMGSNLMLAGFFAFFTIWYVLRTLLTLLLESSTSDLMTPSLIQGVTFSFSILANFGIAALLIAVNAQRLEAELGEAHQELNRKNQDLEQANRELERLSFRDGLSGLMNRRIFDENLDKEWRRMLRSGQPLSLIMADIDYFKQFNDNYGHPAGDDCIRAVARAMEESIRRASDLAARYGGEEFALILPNVTSAGACAVAQAIRAGVREMAIAHQASQADAYVTLSFGVATIFPEISSLPKTLLDMADKALYMSKESGRNRITALEN